MKLNSVKGGAPCDEYRRGTQTSEVTASVEAELKLNAPSPCEEGLQVEGATVQRAHVCVTDY